MTLFALFAQVAELSSYLTAELSIDPRLHPRLIGAKGKSLRKLVDAFPGVDVRFAGHGAADPGVVTVTGPPAPVEACRQRLQELADELVSQ